MKRFPPLSVAAAVLSSLCFIYYVVCGIARSFTVSGLWIWLLFSLILAGCIAIRAAAEPKIPSGRVALIYRRLKMVFLGAATVFLSAFLIFEALLIHTWMKGTGGSVGEADAIIVLGATVEYDTPAPTLERRIRTAAKYALKNPDIPIIACGGLGEGDIITEAECIKRELILLGVDESRIITEDSSTSTAENFRFAEKHIPDDVGSVAVVSSGFHLFRASAIADASFQRAHREKITIVPVSSPAADISLPCSMVREFAAFIRGIISGDI